MADNVNITAGTGTTIAADDIAGVLHQRVKISQGADGAATDVSSAAPLQVTLANTGANTNKILTTPDLPIGASTSAKQDTIIGHVDGIETVLGTIDADTSNISTKIDTIAGAVSGTEVQVDVLTMPTVTVTATNLDVQSGGADLATSTQADAIKTAVETIDNAIVGSEMQVDVVAALPAGTNLVGDVGIQARVGTGWDVANFTSGDTYTALTNTAQAIKASAGKFGGYYIYNPNAVVSYVMIYNIAHGSVTVGTSTAKLVFAIPAYSAANIELVVGIPFDTALSCAAATTGGGNSAPTTALEAMIYYK